MLRMGQTQFDAIRTHGEETYPNECCGVLLGQMEEDGNVVIDAVPAENTRRDSAHNRYHIAPQELIRIQQQARLMGWTLSASIIRILTILRSGRRRTWRKLIGLGCSYVITRVAGSDAGGVDARARCRAMETNSFLLAGTGEEDKRLERQPIEVATEVGVR